MKKDEVTFVAYFHACAAGAEYYHHRNGRDSAGLVPLSDGYENLSGEEVLAAREGKIVRRGSDGACEIRPADKTRLPKLPANDFA